MKTLSLATLAAFLPAIAVASELASCPGQSNCLRVDITEASVGSCVDGGADCQFMVCISLDLNLQNCAVPADTTKMRHSCVKNSLDCQSNHLDFEHSVMETDLSSGHLQCQMAGPDAVVQFMFNDSDESGCSGSGSYDLEGFKSASCVESTSSHCDGATKSCIWEVKTPSCSLTKPERLLYVEDAEMEPMLCDCLDLFTSTAHGDFVLSNQRFSVGSGYLDAQIRRVQIAPERFYNEAALVVIGEQVFEVHGSHYYLNGHRVSIPSEIGGYPVSITNRSRDVEVVSIDFGSTTISITVTNGTGVRKFVKIQQS